MLLGWLKRLVENKIDTVLILVLMEYALRLMEHLTQFELALTVLILVLMEYALRHGRITLVLDGEPLS